ncbi:MAG: alkaline phosphatase family protein [Leucobacter sp.]
MLPTATDNGGRLAAVLPTGLLALANGLEIDPCDAIGVDGAQIDNSLLPKLRSLVLIVVDGLGSANLKARSGHAPTLASLSQRRITTVTPSTTAAAITTLTTGELPAAHGLVGYKIRHPHLGVITSLRDWEAITNRRDWQLAESLFATAERMGVRSFAYGRGGHSKSGFTRAVLTGATYVGGDKIADRLHAAKQQIATGEPTLAYVYIDELDRAGHKEGWQSENWSRRLEQFDTALGDFLQGLPSDTGVIVTADHGMVDVARHQQIVFDLASSEFHDVEEVGGEPRFRSFYLRDGANPQKFAAWLDEREGKRGWVVTREEAFASGVFGSTVAPGVEDRVGDVILAARAQCAYYTSEDDLQSFDMVGQHGSWTDEERGIPLILASALAGSGFARAVETVAKLRTPA